jgi:hypothetical protein
MEIGFRNCLRIPSYDRKGSLEYISFRVCEPRYNEDFRVHGEATCAGSLHIALHHCEGEEMLEDEMCSGELPMLCTRRHAMNGAKWAMVSQSHSLPGISLEATGHATEYCDTPSE